VCVCVCVCVRVCDMHDDDDDGCLTLFAVKNLRRLFVGSEHVIFH